MLPVKRIGIITTLPIAGGSGFTLTNFGIDSNNKSIAEIVQVPKDITVTHLGISYLLSTGTPSTYRISIQGVNSDGEPDGNILRKSDFNPPATTDWNDTWQWLQLESPAALVAGDIFAIVIEHTSGTINGSNFSTFNYALTDYFLTSASAKIGFPYALTMSDGSTWDKQPGNFAILWGVKNTNGVAFGHPAGGLSSESLTISGQRQALRFSLPADVTVQYTISGFRWVGGEAYNNTSRYGIWDEDNNVLASIDKDSDWSDSDQDGSLIEAYFDDPPIITGGQHVYIGIEKVDTNGDRYNIQRFLLTETNDQNAWPGGSGYFFATYDGASWSVDTLSRPLVEVFIDEWFAETEEELIASGVMRLGGAATCDFEVEPIHPVGGLKLAGAATYDFTANVEGVFELYYSTKTASSGDSVSQTDPDASLGKFITTTIWGGNIKNDLFDNVSREEDTALQVDYRCIFVRNEEAFILYDVQVWVSDQLTGGADIAIGVDPTGPSIISSSVDQAVTIVNSITAPVGVTFSTPTTKVTGIYMGHLATLQCRAFWIRRSALGGPTVFDDFCTICVGTNLTPRELDVVGEPSDQFRLNTGSTSSQS